MRVLLAHHLPPPASEAGRFCAELTGALIAAGHQPRLLLVDYTGASHALPSRTVICNPNLPKAECRVALPGFAGESHVNQRWSALTTIELAEYREALRQALDAEVSAFDPEIIHAQHIWLWAQLALESGVPYVISAWGPELDAAREDARFRELAEQGAENAGRIAARHRDLPEKIAALYPGAAERIVPAPEAAADWVALYQRVIDERFGR